MTHPSTSLWLAPFASLFFAFFLHATPPPVPLTGILEPQVETFGTQMALSTDTLAVVNSGQLFIYDKSHSPPWSLRKTIAVSGWRVAHNRGDLVGVMSDTAVEIYQRNLGGANNWGLLATVPKKASSAQLQNLGFSGDWLALVEETGSPGVYEITMHLRDNPSPNSWSTFVTITNPLPPAGGQIGFAGSLDLDGNLLVVSGVDATAPPELVFHAYRKDQNGVNFWGRVGTVRRTTFAGVNSFNTAPALSGGRVVCTARITALPSQNTILVLQPPASFGGAWGLDNCPEPTGTVVNFATQVKSCGNDCFAVNLVRPLPAGSLSPGAHQGYVAIYRGIGILEREAPVGSAMFVDSAAESLPVPVLGAAASDVFAATARASASAAEKVAPRVVEVHERNAGGTNQWMATALIPPQPATPGRFGNSIAINGLLMAVGDPEAAEGGGETGAVHIYERSQVLINDWQLVRTLRMAAPVVGSRFGSDIDISTQGIVAVTAPGSDQVVVFKNSALLTTLSRPAGINSSDDFARSVAISPSGADIFVGAPSAFGSGSATVRTGAVVHFRAVNPANPTTYSLHTIYRGALPADEGASLGWSVDATEDTLAAGGWTDEDLGNTPRGMATVWNRAGAAVTFTPQTVVYPPDPSRGLFGIDVALGFDHGNLRLLVGTTPPLFGSNTGGAFLFHKPSSGLWTHLMSFLPNNPQSGYGMSVALNDGVAAVGSPIGLGSSTAGGVELFFPSNPSGSFAGRKIVVPTFPTSGEGFGTAVAFDACGLIVGSPLVDRVTTFRFGGYERWLGDKNVPDLRTFRASSDNPDGDDLNNLLEYVGGGNPLSGTGPQGEAFLSFTDINIRVFHWYPAGAEFSYYDDATVEIQRSLDGLSWELAPFTVPASSPVAVGYYFVSPPPSQPCRMLFRYKATYPAFR